jgi:DNA end-binding protein Ku
MKRTRRIAVGRHGARGREQLVLLRPYRGGLALHHVYYADEVRPMDEIELPRRMTFREAEEGLADRLIEQLSADAFEPEKYHDEYRDRVLAAAARKAAGQEIAAAPAPPDAHVIDLLDALKRSLTGRPRAGEVRGRARAEPPLSAGARSAALPPRAKGVLEARRERGPLRKTAPRRRAGQGKTGAGG